MRVWPCGGEREWDGEREGKGGGKGFCYHIAESATNQFRESLAMLSRCLGKPATIKLDI